MDINSENKNNPNPNANPNNKCMIINNEDPEIYWNSALLIIVLILFGILMFYKISHISNNCITNYEKLSGTIDASSIFNSIKV